jgi:hypothetical protein
LESTIHRPRWTRWCQRSSSPARNCDSRSSSNQVFLSDPSAGDNRGTAPARETTPVGYYAPRWLPVYFSWLTRSPESKKPPCSLPTFQDSPLRGIAARLGGIRRRSCPRSASHDIILAVGAKKKGRGRVRRNTTPSRLSER